MTRVSLIRSTPAIHSIRAAHIFEHFIFLLVDFAFLTYVIHWPLPECWMRFCVWSWLMARHTWQKRRSKKTRIPEFACENKHFLLWGARVRTMQNGKRAQKLLLAGSALTVERLNMCRWLFVTAIDQKSVNNYSTTHLAVPLTPHNRRCLILIAFVLSLVR